MEVELKALLPFLQELEQYVCARTEKALKNEPQQTFHSPAINELASALSVAQKSFKEISFNRRNPMFLTQYVDYHNIKEAVKDALAENGLTVIHSPKDDGTIAILDSMLVHSSGQYMSCSSRINIVAGDSTVYISLLNEFKKQHILSLLGISAKDNPEEDDLEAEAHIRRGEVQQGTSLRYNFQPISDEYERINKTQLDELDYELASDDMKDIYNEILKNLRITRLSEIPKSQYRKTKEYIQRIKASRRKID